MGIVVIAVSLVALTQGAAWLGPRRGLPKARRGAVATTLGVLGIGLGLLLWLVPGFVG